MKISDVDKNFAVSGASSDSGIVFVDCRHKPFELSGNAHRDDGAIRRLTETVENSARPELIWLGKHTSGIRLRFRTNSTRIYLRVTMPEVLMMRHMPLTGSSGFDVYCGDRFETIFAPVTLAEKTFEQGHLFVYGADESGMRDVTVNFPLYNDITSVAVGLDSDSLIEPPKPTKYGRVVFYGSSITQGGVASRPGNNYANILARRLDFELYNLGFSGNAFGDTVISDYIASMKLAAFVMDYDFNARSITELETTHLPFYLRVRSGNPDAPIVMMSNPVPGVGTTWETAEIRNAVIMKTVREAERLGDKNVRFIEGSALLGNDERDTCTTDRIHPNDLGFFRMAMTVEPVLREMLENKE